MNAADKDAVRGLLLTSWLADLRQDRAPQPLPEMELLSATERAEVLELARFYKATLYPTPATGIEVDRVGSRLKGRIQQEQLAARQRTASLLQEGVPFGRVIQAARQDRQINARRLEAAIAVASGTVGQLETTEMPPHRLPMDKLVALLRALGLASHQMVGVVRQASLEWAQRVYAQPATQLGRTDAEVTDEERRQLLEDGEAGADQAALAGEVASVEQFCRALSSRLR